MSKNIKGWEWYEWGDLITKYQQGAIRSNNELGVGDTFYLKMGDFGGKGSYSYEDLAVTESSEEEIREFKLYPGDFLINVRNSREIVGKSCVIDTIPEGTIFNHMLVRIEHKEGIPSEYVNAWLNTEYVKRFIDGIKTGTTTIIALYQADLYRIPILIPTDAHLRYCTELIRKIERKKRINQEISILIKKHIMLLFEYWFIQFEFPNNEGKPYRSSGGEMVFNEILEKEIPEGWDVYPLENCIDKYISGDWGKDVPSGNHKNEVSCIRGTDIETMVGLPQRYILNANSNKLLEKNNMVIEISGGSPIQATGRSVLISEGMLNRNKRKLICSNFCQCITFKDESMSAYFYYLWNEIYDSGNMFNYEGKTSGIKNLQFDALLANYWYFAPEKLRSTFYTFVDRCNDLVDNAVIENKKLDEVKEKMYPILLNGQVVIKSDASATSKQV